MLGKAMHVYLCVRDCGQFVYGQTYMWETVPVVAKAAARRGFLVVPVTAATTKAKRRGRPPKVKPEES